MIRGRSSVSKPAGNVGIDATNLPVSCEETAKPWNLGLAIQRVSLVLQLNDDNRRSLLRRLLTLLFVMPSVFALLRVLISDSSSHHRLLILLRPSSNGISDLRDVGYASRPRAFSYVVVDDGTVMRSVRIPVHFHRYPSKRPGEYHAVAENRDRQKRLRDSDDYGHDRRDPFAVNGCAPRHDWQTTFHPTCNEVHALADLARGDAVLADHGYWRDVWLATDAASATSDDSARSAVVVLKTLRYEHDYVDRNYDRHRRDAVAAERLTASRHVVDIYGFCGQSGVFRNGEGGDLERHMWPSVDERGDRRKQKRRNTMTKLQRVKVALHIALALSDTHNADEVGESSIAHTDITPGQFVLVDGVFMLNDFNRCRFLTWNAWEQRSCGYMVGSNPGKFRSPEEYKYLVQDEKVDVYSTGNIFYGLLTDEWPFDRVSEKEAKRKVIAGDRPKIPNHIRQSNVPEDLILLKVIEMCWTQDPRKRATALEVEKVLTAFVEKRLDADPKKEEEAKEDAST